MLLNYSRVGAPAWQIAHHVRRGDTTAVTVIADHLDHARIANRVLDALRVVRASEVLAEAETVDDQADLGALALAGVPVAVPEDTPVAGLRAWSGSAAKRFVADRTPVAQRDHEVVRRLRGAGALILGLARGSQLGRCPSTDDGSAVTRNPWRSDRCPGGPAGGLAASVAAGIVPLAVAADRLGALRIPAAACGLVALAPTVREPTRAHAGGYGVVATTVADVRLGYAVVSGVGTQDDDLPGRLRIVVSGRPPWPGAGADGPARAALAAVARRLVEVGHDVRVGHPPYPRLLLPLTVAARAELAYAAAGTDLAAPRPRTRQSAAFGEVVARRGPGPSLRTADVGGRIVGWLATARADVLVVPGLGGPPPPAAAWSSRSWLANAGPLLGAGSYGLAWSLCGLPAVIVPQGVRRDGTPTAVQLIGPPGAERLLLALADQLERAAPWPPRAPGWPRRHGRRRRVEGPPMLAGVMGRSGT